MTGSSNDAKDTARWASAREGQFFERKSAWDRAGSAPRPRKATDVAWDIVETLAAMANADGGDLLVGIEDGGEVTGVPHPEDMVALLLRAAGDRSYVDPPLRVQMRRVVAPGNLLLLYFTVDWSPDVHRLADSRTLLRVADTNQPFPSEKIAALKALKTQGMYERSYPHGAGIEDLDLALLGLGVVENGPVISEASAPRVELPPQINPLMDRALVQRLGDAADHGRQVDRGRLAWLRRSFDDTPMATHTPSPPRCCVRPVCCVPKAWMGGAQTRKSHVVTGAYVGAGDEIPTRDVDLGKVN